MDQSTTIALLNMKGGVGKTALAVNLAWHLCRYGERRVLLVDLDPQFNASQYLMEPEKWDQHRIQKGTVADLLIEPGKPAMSVRNRKKRQPGISNCIFARESSGRGGKLDLLPSELGLAAAVKNPHAVAYKLEKNLEYVRAEYDYILIDCAPTDSILTDTALMASDYILTPVRPDRLSVVGYGLMQKTLDAFREAYHDPHKVKDLGVVFTQVGGRSKVEEECMTDIEEQAEYVFQVRIAWSESYSRSVHEKSPIFATRHAHWATKEAISELVTEMEQRISDLGSSEDDDQ